MKNVDAQFEENRWWFDVILGIYRVDNGYCLWPRESGKGTQMKILTLTRNLTLVGGFTVFLWNANNCISRAHPRTQEIWNLIISTLSVGDLESHP
jgi:hypothetical protein